MKTNRLVRRSVNRAAMLLASLIVCGAFSGIAGQNDPLLIISPKGDLFEAAIKGMENELKDEFAIMTMVVGEATKVDDIHEKFVASHPRAVVLIGNNSIRLYTQHAHEHKEETDAVPVVTIFALDVKRAVSGLDSRAQCIAYETPMVTAIVNFRRVMNKPITSVGVVYRKAFEEFVTRHTEYCRKENIAVKSVLIGEDPSAHKKEIARALEQLVKQQHVQAFWVPNDNVILKPELLIDVWLPLFTKQKVPVIVGVEALVKPEINFGTYAVIPEPVAMGEQAAGLILDLKDDDWKFYSTVVYPAISMYSVLNLKKAVLVNDVKNINISEVTRVLTEGKK
jgi:hypothetical protein